MVLNILDSVGHRVPVPITQFYCSNRKAATDNTSMSGSDYVPIKLY